jgi:hypothetical protein
MELPQIRNTLQAKPFRPFTMWLVDGREYTVPHPEFLYVPPGMRHTVLYANTQTQAVTILDAVMIASITFPDEPPSAGTAGTGGGPNGA